MRKIRINYLTGYMSPHILPLLNSVGEHPGFDLRVWYCNGDTGFRGWAHSQKPTHSYTVSKRRPMRLLHPEFHFDPAIVSFIREREADITIISEYDIPSLRLAIEYLNMKKLPWILRGERPITGDKPLWRILLGDIIRNRPLRTARAIIANGSLNADVYRELSPWGTPIYSIPYYLEAGRDIGSREDGAAIFAELTGQSISEDRFYFLFAGEMTRRKGVLFLIDVFNEVAEKNDSAALILIGDGPLRSLMERRLTVRAREKTFFLGKIEFEKVTSLYYVAHAFVFPTQHDGWGMVVNEAMAAGLPVITTSACGAARDLVREGENGHVLSSFDMEGFVRQMLLFAENPGIALRMGQASKNIISMHSPKQGAEYLYTICRGLAESP